MANNKIILGDEVLMDLTEDTVTEDTLFEGETAHDASGNKIIGRARGGASEWDEIKNYDKLSFFKKLLIRLRFTWKNTKAELVLSDEIVESIVDLMLPDIISFFESEEGKKEFEEWKAEQAKKKNVEI